MKKKLTSILITSLLLFSCDNRVFNNNVNTAQNEIQNKTNETLLLKIKENISKNKITEINKKLGITDFKILSSELNLAEIKTSNNEVSKIKTEYLKNNLVEYIEKDAKLNIFSYEAQTAPYDKKAFELKAGKAKPNDTFYPLQWNMTSIDADKAWTVTTGNSNVIVAVIDSGVDPDHPDLQDNLLPLIDVLGETGERDVYGFGTSDVDYSGKDGNGHGTHVAGIIGAMVNNQKGVAGLAGNVKILPIKAANYDGGTSASIITRSIMKAIENKVKVINLSIGGPKSEGTQALKDAVDLAISKGIVFVSATGNESSRSKGVIEDVTVPAAYTGVISVAAITDKDKVANYSNGGAEVEIVAPGGGGLQSEGAKIYSTWPTYKTFEGYRSGVNGPYAYLSGTSMACPHISAVAALLFAKFPNITGQQVRVRILANAKEIGQKGFNFDVGYGKLNAYDSLMNGSHDRKELTN